MGAIRLIFECIYSSFTIVRALYNTGSAESKVRVPYMCDDEANEYYDISCGHTMPMFVWWDAEYDAGRAIPRNANYAPRDSPSRARYVANSFQRVERSRRVRCIDDIDRGAITLTEANDRMNAWYRLRDELETVAIPPQFAVNHDKECGICLDDVTNVKCLPCGHELCNTCFDMIRSMGIDLTCPYCRSAITEYVYDEAYYIV